MKVGVAVTDLTTGLYTSNSIMAALIGRGRTGKGQHIDVALSDCQVATLTNIASSALISGKKDSGRWGTAHRKLTVVTSNRDSNKSQRQSYRTRLSRPLTATSFLVVVMTGCTESWSNVLRSRNGQRTRGS